MEKSLKYQIYIVHHDKENYPVKKSEVAFHIQAGTTVQNKKAEMDCYDNTGDGNIAAKERYYSEYTATYWIWKNSSADIIGLMHYRRTLFLTVDYPPQYQDDYYADHGVSRKALDLLIKNYDMAVGYPDNFGYTPIASQHRNNHPLSDEFFAAAKEAIKTKYPDMMGCFQSHFYNRYQPAYFKCQIVAKRKMFNEYMEYVFYVLGEIEKSLHSKVVALGDRGNRLYAFMGERLMSLFVAYHLQKKTKVKIVPIMFYDSVSKLNDYHQALKTEYGKNPTTASDPDQNYPLQLFYHQKQGNSSDQRISLNINFIGHDSGDWSAVYKNSKFHLYRRNASVSNSENSELGYLDKYNVKNYASVTKDKLYTRKADETQKKEITKFTYATWRNDGYYDAQIVYWNEPFFNYLKEDLCGRKIFSFFENREARVMGVGSKIYYKSGAQFCAAEYLLFSKTWKITYVIDQPKVADRSEYTAQISFTSGSQTHTLALRNNDFLIDGNSCEYAQLPDWEGKNYYIYPGQWFPYNATLPMKTV